MVEWPVLHEGVRGTICDDGWIDANAAVVCRQIGLPCYTAESLEKEPDRYYFIMQKSIPTCSSGHRDSKNV